MRSKAIAQMRRPREQEPRLSQVSVVTGNSRDNTKEEDQPKGLPSAVAGNIGHQSLATVEGITTHEPKGVEGGNRLLEPSEGWSHWRGPPDRT